MSLIESFQELLKAKGTSEQSVQDFLERHTELFYPPFEQNHGVEHDLLISKFQLDTTLTTDFAYLTKSSALWWLVLLEIEHPSKLLFTKAGVPSADLTAAMHQVRTWKTFVNRNAPEIARRIAPLKKPMELNKLSFKYALVIGRSDEFANDQAKKDTLAELQSDDLKILTYDSVIHAYQDQPNPILDVVSQKGLKFALKYRHRTDTAIFAWLSANDIHLAPEDIDYYKQHGYDIDSWLAGKPLVNRKQTADVVRQQLTQRTTTPAIPPAGTKP